MVFLVKGEIITIREDYSSSPYKFLHLYQRLPFQMQRRCVDLTALCGGESCSIRITHMIVQHQVGDSQY